ncbi:hypothetical protein [Paraburkholderia humisilvae]|uniref:Uncharacterized protein n=1 Tax=Paraburkholderia humisilvae TaxID=627669 RepID=A0A6J5DPQ1_9BURK|nr:hypothetical protein [Paraburkholderia humisilvae]CAB3755913.1 hypothetical protein LMG29542_02727 [Paraburkholderia humisilvae]
MALLPEHSSAQLVMLAGNLCSTAELALYLEQFDYREDPNEAGHWMLVSRDPGHADCSLRIENEGETITVYGEAVDHFARVNYLVQKAGWAECSLLSRDDDVEARLAGRLVSVGIMSATTTSIPASTLSVSAMPMPAAALAPTEAVAGNTPASVRDPHGFVETTVSPAASPAKLEQSNEKRDPLTMRNNALEQKVTGLESENARLTNQLNAALAARPVKAVIAPEAADPAPGHIDALALLSAIEDHVSQTLDLSAIHGTQLVKDLRKLGYVFKVRLVPAAMAQ